MPPARLALAAALLLVPGPALACLDAAVADALPGRQAFALAPTGVSAAWFAGPSRAYAHGALGALPDADTLRAFLNSDGTTCDVLTVEAGPGHVFEDVAPRFSDLGGDDRSGIVAVRSSLTRGAQLAIYADAGDGHSLRLLASTPYIGTRHRWLAPVGATDLDGDGATEIAYVDRPHLDRILRVWRYEGGALREVAAMGGVTNHRFGEPMIEGGVRDCGDGPEMIVADAGWTRALAVTLGAGGLAARDLGPIGAGGLGTAMACR